MRRALLVGVTAVTCLIVITLIAFSPLALAGLEGLRKDWGRLSNIGQAYGAISALASSLALVGIAVSLLYQARAGHTAREQSIRTLQQQLIKMEMEDPTLMTAMGAPWGLPIPAESTKIRAHLFVHMWAMFWAGSYAVGEMSVAAVRDIARLELFNSRAGRTYWAAVRENLLKTNQGKYQRFARIVDEEYQKIIASNPQVADPVRITDYIDNSSSRQRKDLQQVTLVGAAALVTGLLAGRKFSHWVRKMR